MKILFLCLGAFSVTGGTEKYNRAFMKALKDISSEKNGIEYKVLSAYDDRADERYIHSRKFKGYRAGKFKFSLEAVKEGIKSDKIIISHINLSPIGLIIKILRTKTKFYLSAHGIEIWNKLPLLKKQALRSADAVLAVSNYTKRRIIESHNYNPEKILIVPNTLDPFFRIPEKYEKPAYLLERYNLTEKNKILLSVGRVFSTEHFKGYDKVIELLPDIKTIYPEIKFLIAGKYSPEEKKRLESIIEKYKLDKYVLIPGFIQEEEITDHYLLADLFVMPSKKEGFGIVFIEALACGLNVIAGNMDGSVDALKNGELGTLVNPDNKNEIRDAIIRNINLEKDKSRIQKKIIEEFGFEKFKEKLNEIFKL